ncbi:MAG: L,D-transpeptidase [Acidimicrobiales bacterium]
MSRRSTILMTGFVVAVLAAGCSAGQAALPAHQDQIRAHTGTATTRAPTTTPTTAAPSTTTAPAVPASTVVATTHGAIPGSASPGAPPDTTVPGDWYGYPTILPVIGEQAGWLDVRLAQRPNESTTWIPASDADLSSTPYLIVINLTTEHLTVYRAGSEVMDFPAGIGTPDDPTVPGNFFVTMIAPPPDPGYGPFVMVTSEHSDTISDWEQSGDAIMAIHGPIDSYDDSLIGTTGAQISHGCVRLHDSDLAQLAPIPPGTPIDILP